MIYLPIIYYRDWLNEARTKSIIDLYTEVDSNSTIQSRCEYIKDWFVINEVDKGFKQQFQECYIPPSTSKFPFVTPFHIKFSFVCAVLFPKMIFVCQCIMLWCYSVSQDNYVVFDTIYLVFIDSYRSVEIERSRLTCTRDVDVYLGFLLLTWINVNQSMDK